MTDESTKSAEGSLEQDLWQKPPSSSEEEFRTVQSSWESRVSLEEINNEVLEPAVNQAEVYPEVIVNPKGFLEYRESILNNMRYRELEYFIDVNYPERM